MVEVFKTDVSNTEAAGLLLLQLQKIFTNCRINFDLTDCDRILRMETQEETIHANAVIELLKDYGFRAVILPDEVPANQTAR